MLQQASIVGFYSAKLKGTELNYTTTEKEVLGILKTLRNFKTIVLCSEIKIFTDNTNLIAGKDLSKRFQRWKLELEEYSYTLDHVTGSGNTVADTLSRLNVITANEIEKTSPYQEAYNLSKIYSAQQEDDDLRRDIDEKTIIENQLIKLSNFIRYSTPRVD